MLQKIYISNKWCFKKNNLTDPKTFNGSLFRQNHIEYSLHWPEF